MPVRSLMTDTCSVVGQARRELRQQRLHAVDDLDDVGARLALHVDEHRRQRRSPRPTSRRFSAPSTTSRDVAQPQRRAVAIRDDQSPGRPAASGADRWRRA